MKNLKKNTNSCHINNHLNNQYDNIELKIKVYKTVDKTKEIYDIRKSKN